MPTPVWITCDQLKSYRFDGNDNTIVAGGECRLNKTIAVTGNRVIIRGDNTVLRPPPKTYWCVYAGDDPNKGMACTEATEATDCPRGGTCKEKRIDAFNVLAGTTDVLIAGFRLERGTDEAHFNEGIVVRPGARGISVQDIRIIGATGSAGISLPDDGAVCIGNTTVQGVSSDTDVTSTGYIVKSAGGNGGGTVEFRQASALLNNDDGFAIKHGTGHARLKKALFVRTSSDGNAGDGYDVTGEDVEMLCVEASNNEIVDPPGSPENNRGRGVIMWDPADELAGVLHLENAHIRDNEGVGVLATGARTTARIIGSTVAANNQKVATDEGQQVQVRTGYVYDTIGVGKVFMAPPPAPAPTWRCGSNVHSSGGACGSVKDTAAMFADADSKSELRATAPPPLALNGGQNPRAIVPA